MLCSVVTFPGHAREVDSPLIVTTVDVYIYFDPNLNCIYNLGQNNKYYYYFLEYRRRPFFQRQSSTILRMQILALLLLDCMLHLKMIGPTIYLYLDGPT